MRFDVGVHFVEEHEVSGLRLGPSYAPEAAIPALNDLLNAVPQSSFVVLVQFTELP